MQVRYRLGRDRVQQAGFISLEGIVSVGQNVVALYQEERGSRGEGERTGEPRGQQCSTAGEGRMRGQR